MIKSHVVPFGLLLRLPSHKNRGRYAGAAVYVRRPETGDSCLLGASDERRAGRAPALIMGIGTEPGPTERDW